ncbi:hypothetical protein L2E82_40227 [Cichorium intybus]|uniref:Uncharacterized protein n=1 Tax=Cichorium intybus TaxID=13427 RepID=A0ACB9AL23_CICIN|nr:hypothetical protein L2E82_40227 [Cichorium intybus]
MRLRSTAPFWFTGSEVVESKRRDRHKPGTEALREIRPLQKTVNLLIPAAPFIRTVTGSATKKACIIGKIDMKNTKVALHTLIKDSRILGKKFPVLTFNFLRVREISNYFAPEVIRWQAEALQALQEAAEDYLVQLFEESMLCSYMQSV